MPGSTVSTWPGSRMRVVRRAGCSGGGGCVVPSGRGKAARHIVDHDPQVVAQAVGHEGTDEAPLQGLLGAALQDAGGVQEGPQLQVGPVV